MLLASAIGGWIGPGDPTAAADPAPFLDVSASTLAVERSSSGAAVTIEPDEFRSLLLDRSAMEAVLSSAPSGRDGGGSLVLELPAPDGGFAAFEVWESAVMAPGLAAQFPEIRTYAGQGRDDPAATIVFDLTPHGFHAQVLGPGGNWYIDPAIHLDDRFHVSYDRDDLTRNPHGDMIEHNADEIDRPDATRPAPRAAERSGAVLRTHRIAVAANATYTAAHGGTRASAQAAIVTAINRVGGIYEKELAIALQLVANNATLVFESSAGPCAGPAHTVTAATGGSGTSEIELTTASPHGLAADDVVLITGNGFIDGTWAVRSVSSPTRFVVRGTFSETAVAAGTAARWDVSLATCDPYNNDTDDIEVNQGVVDQLVGDVNYDIGHVFTTGSGGVAGFGVVGVSGAKARGTTGLPSPIGDKFWVDFVAHEIGHQYGGSHTWNGTRGNCSAGAWGGSTNGFEPGSGSTIQAYAGICGLDDLQNAGQAGSGDGTNASDPYFHSRSFDQIVAHTTGGAPGDIGAAPSGNAVPTVDAGPDVTVPAQTPFFLNPSGSDPDGDTLTYNVEQRDGGLRTALDAPQVTAGPLYRSFPPTTSRTHHVPRLTDVASGNTNQNGPCPVLDGTTRGPADCLSQYLVPTAGPIAVGGSRSLAFRATVRDNRAGGGGVATDDAAVTVFNTGTPFAVTTPNGGGPLSGTTTVTWDVAGTTSAPVGAATVSIRISTDGGLTFPTTLLNGTPNDGAQLVTLPNLTTASARIMVHSGHYTGGPGFFDVSDADVGLAASGTTAPSSPVFPTAVPGDGEVTVAWTAPVSDGGSPITGYTVTAAPGGASCTTSSTSCTVAGLTGGLAYVFHVVATNAIGSSPAASTPATTPTGDSFTAVTPSRLEDSRGSGKIGDGTLTATPLRFNVLDRGGLPATGVGAVSLNVTVDVGERPTVGRGYVTVDGCATPRPTTSNINFDRDQTIANAVLTPVSPTGDVCIFVYGRAHIIVDVNGWYAG